MVLMTWICNWNTIQLSLDATSLVDALLFSKPLTVGPRTVWERTTTNWPQCTPILLTGLTLHTIHKHFTFDCTNSGIIHLTVEWNRTVVIYKCHEAATGTLELSFPCLCYFREVTFWVTSTYVQWIYLHHKLIDVIVATTCTCTNFTAIFWIHFLPVYKEHPCHVLSDLQAMRDYHQLFALGRWSNTLLHLTQGQLSCSASIVQPRGSERLEWRLSMDS